ncbi:MAG: uracil-DNA glycosylase family protein [Flavitalea sp.]
MTFVKRVIEFYEQLRYDGALLPSNIRIMNPYAEEEQVASIVHTFYNKYYNDTKSRHLILGINPGRFGAALTGIPFTDPKKLVSECKLNYEGKITHEPSSVFVYEMITAYGGPAAFYSDFYINSVCPLGFVSLDRNGREKNYNYYDSPELTSIVKTFIIENIRKQIALGVNTNICFCFGTGKNKKFLLTLNEEYHFFTEIVALEHPRFIMQYKSNDRQHYINKYLEAFKRIGNT